MCISGTGEIMRSSALRKVDTRKDRKDGKGERATGVGGLALKAQSLPPLS